MSNLLIIPGVPQEKQNEAKDRFVLVYQSVNKVDKPTAEAMFEMELFHFCRQLEETPALAECTEMSKIGVFMEVIQNGLSFDKQAKHIYLMPKNMKVGEGWQKRLTYSYAAEGLIYLAKAAGAVQDVEPATIVYEGDKIAVKTINGRRVIEHEPMIPRKSNKIVGGYTYVTTPFGRDAFWFDIAEVPRLKKASEKQNNGKANALYTSDDGQIDAGFFATKVIKAALNKKPKKKTGNAFEDREEVWVSDAPQLAEPAERIYTDNLNLDF
jgi:recombinational DNA repair protein RecT